MYLLNSLLDRMSLISQRIEEMQSDLNNIHPINRNNDSCSWKTILKDKIGDIRNGIESLDKYSKQLNKKKLSLQNDIKILNHEISLKKKENLKHYHNKELQKVIENVLPLNYNFEIHKIIWRLSQCSPQCKRIGLQFPEGLLMYSCIISDILEEFGNVECIILGDVTYGACCIDDYTSSALHCGFLIHFGHSCLISINNMNHEYHQRILYIFVEIMINEKHLIETIKMNFDIEERIAIAGTIQFAHCIQSIKHKLCVYNGYNWNNIIIPQCTPLSPSEVLGCTAPDLHNVDSLIFIADGRFHLEAIMIANPQINYYRYNPYDNKITKEIYNTDLMLNIRYKAVNTAQEQYDKDKKWCIIISTLGRQGNINIYKRLCIIMKNKNIQSITVLLSEIYGNKLNKFDLNQIQCFVQIGCPRLSIDWGHSFNIPLLNPYEATVALQQVKWKSVYPMDYYRSDGGIWSNYYMTQKEKKEKDLKRIERRKQLRLQRLHDKNKKTNNHIVVHYQ